MTAEQIRKTKAFAADSSIKQHNWNIPDWDPDTSETENEIIILAAAAEDCRLQRLEASNLRKVFDSEIFARRKLIKVFFVASISNSVILSHFNNVFRGLAGGRRVSEC